MHTGSATTGETWSSVDKHNVARLVFCERQRELPALTSRWADEDCNSESGSLPGFCPSLPSTAWDGIGGGYQDMVNILNCNAGAYPKASSGPLVVRGVVGPSASMHQRFNDVHAVQHVSNQNLWIFAVKDEVFTKMIGVTLCDAEEVAPRQARYKIGSVNRDQQSISEAWNIGCLYGCANSPSDRGYYLASIDIRMNAADVTQGIRSGCTSSFGEDDGEEDHSLFPSCEALSGAYLGSRRGSGVSQVRRASWGSLPSTAWDGIGGRYQDMADLLNFSSLTCPQTDAGPQVVKGVVGPSASMRQQYNDVHAVQHVSTQNLWIFAVQHEVYCKMIGVTLCGAEETAPRQARYKIYSGSMDQQSISEAWDTGSRYGYVGSPSDRGYYLASIDIQMQGIAEETAADLSKQSCSESEDEEASTACGSERGACVSDTGDSQHTEIVQQQQQEQQQQHCLGITDSVPSSIPDMTDDARTTVMLRNLPTDYTREMLMDLLEREGFGCAYTFLYLPIDFKKKNALGYAFVDLATAQTVSDFWRKFDGFADVCAVSWCEPHQGLQAHIERYRNSSVMHDSVPDENKPVLMKEGRRVPFPRATQKIRFPRVRDRQPGRT